MKHQRTTFKSMTIKKTDIYKKRVIWQSVPLFVIGFSCLIYGVKNPEEPNINRLWMVIITCMVLIFLLGVIRRHTFRCPDCDALLSPRGGNWYRGHPVMFVCEHCRVTWDTGLITSDWKED